MLAHGGGASAPWSQRHNTCRAAIVEAARAMLAQLSSLARDRLPARVYGPIRARRVRRLVTSFEPRVVEHDYAGFRLKASIEDPLGEGWYDHDWDESGELSELRNGRLR